MFGGKTPAEIAHLIEQFQAAVERRARHAAGYHAADREVRRLKGELVGLLPGSQHEVSVQLNETVERKEG